MKRILIADDQPQLRILLNATLSLNDYQLFEAADGEQALAMIEAHKPDLVILDWMMPKLTGIQVAESLRDNPETASIPVIMLTARGMQRDRQIGKLAGIKEYVVKPFSPNTLLEIVEGILNGVAVAQ